MNGKLNGPNPAAGQIQVPQLVIELGNAGAQVLRGEAGNRTLVIGPLLVTVTIPFGEEGARIVARELAAGIEIAHGGLMPFPKPKE